MYNLIRLSYKSWIIWKSKMYTTNKISVRMLYQVILRRRNYSIHNYTIDYCFFSCWSNKNFKQTKIITTHSIKKKPTQNLVFIFFIHFVINVYFIFTGGKKKEFELNYLKYVNNFYFNKRILIEYIKILIFISV